MNNDNSEIIKQLNDFLKGINMGYVAFEDFANKAHSGKLKREITCIMSKFSNHKKIVISLIEKLGGEPKDSLGIIGEMATMFGKLKEVFMNTDEEVLENAIKGMDMGVQGGEKVISYLEDINADDAIITILRDIVEDYSMTYSHLKNLSQNKDL